MNAKLTELKAGDKVKVTGFDCMPNGVHEVLHDGSELYLVCNRGKHFLRESDDGDTLEGITLA